MECSLPSSQVSQVYVGSNLFLVSNYLSITRYLSENGSSVAHPTDMSFPVLETLGQLEMEGDFPK
jgi:hypothetical protein